MKTTFLLGISLLSIVCLTSCDEASKLASAVEGKWQSPMTEVISKKQKDHKEEIHDNAVKQEKSISMSCAPSITFTRTQDSKGGDIRIAGQFEMTHTVTLTDTTLSAPVNAIVSGTIVASGTWTAHDDDEIIVALDQSKTDVTVDPASLKLEYAALTDADASKLDSLKARIAPNINSVVIPAIKQKISSVTEFDDVKVTGNTMKLEIGKTKLNFTKE